MVVDCPDCAGASSFHLCQTCGLEGAIVVPKTPMSEPQPGECNTTLDGLLAMRERRGLSGPAATEVETAAEAVAGAIVTLIAEDQELGASWDELSLTSRRTLTGEIQRVVNEALDGGASS
jgi:hypothetical protein